MYGTFRELSDDDDSSSRSFSDEESPRLEGMRHFSHHEPKYGIPVVDDLHEPPHHSSLIEPVRFDELSFERDAEDANVDWSRQHPTEPVVFSDGAGDDAPETVYLSNARRIPLLGLGRRRRKLDDKVLIGVPLDRVDMVYPTSVQGTFLHTAKSIAASLVRQGETSMDAYVPPLDFDPQPTVYRDEIVMITESGKEYRHFPGDVYKYGVLHHTPGDDSAPKTMPDAPDLTVHIVRLVDKKDAPKTSSFYRAETDDKNARTKVFKLRRGKADAGAKVYRAAFPVDRLVETARFTGATPTQFIFPLSANYRGTSISEQTIRTTGGFFMILVDATQIQWIVFVDFDADRLGRVSSASLSVQSAAIGDVALPELSSFGAEDDTMSIDTSSVTKTEEKEPLSSPDYTMQSTTNVITTDMKRFCERFDFEFMGTGFSLAAGEMISCLVDHTLYAHFWDEENIVKALNERKLLACIMRTPASNVVEQFREGTHPGIAKSEEWVRATYANRLVERAPVFASLAGTLLTTAILCRWSYVSTVNKETQRLETHGIPLPERAPFTTVSSAHTQYDTKQFVADCETMLHELADVEEKYDASYVEHSYFKHSFICESVLERLLPALIQRHKKYGSSEMRAAAVLFRARIYKQIRTIHRVMLKFTITPELRTIKTSIFLLIAMAAGVLQAGGIAPDKVKAALDASQRIATEAELIDFTNGLYDALDIVFDANTR